MQLDYVGNLVVEELVGIVDNLVVDNDLDGDDQKIVQELDREKLNL